MVCAGYDRTVAAFKLKNITQLVPDAKVVAIHMDAINQCGLTKSELREFIAGENLGERIFVPDEGDILSLN